MKLLEKVTMIAAVPILCTPLGRLAFVAICVGRLLAS